MQAFRVQPLTVMAVTAVLALTRAWTPLLLFGLVMLVGALHPPANLLDRWVSLVIGSKHQTVLDPKRFATGMGGTMLAAAGAAGLLGAQTTAWVFAAMTFGAAGLLGVFKFCLGCWIYNTIVYPYARRQEA